MARFVFLSDTHIGTDPLGYQQQPGYPRKTPELLAALDEWITEQGDIDFIIHGGDLVNSAAREHIVAARAMLDLSVPVYLCLGNHDMMGPKAVELWLTHAPDLLYGGSPDGVLTDPTVRVHILPTHWCRTPYYWQDEEDPHFGPAQLTRIRRELAKSPEIPHILVTHSQVLSVPAAQTGLDEPLGGPKGSFTQVVTDLASEHPQLRCILSGHTHINMHVRRSGTHFVTVSAFPESPFEFKVVQTDAAALTMATFSLADRVGFASRYDFDKTYVQGRPIDRGFTEPL